MAVQLAAIAVMSLHPKPFILFFTRRPKVLPVLVSSSVLLPLVQLIPLPPALWQSLPGRDMVTASFDLIGGPGWCPFSLDKGRTLTAFLGTLAPLTIIVIGSSLPPERLRWLVQIVVVIGVAAMFYGSLRLVSEGSTGMRLSATFADWNAAAVFFGGCLMLAIALFPRPSIRPAADGSALSTMLLAAASMLLLTGVVLTQSRTGIVLLVVPLGLVVLRFAWNILPGVGNETGLLAGRTTLIAVLTGGLVVVGVCALSRLDTGRIAAVFARFEGRDDGKRAEMREDALSAAHRYWPVGAGMGTFDEIFQVDESLEYLSPRRAGRAHMDYYELAIEAGLMGLLLAASWLVWVFIAAWRALHAANWPGLAGAGFLACCAMQSLLSFPLRNQTMLVMAALAIVLLVNPHRSKRERQT